MLVSKTRRQVKRQRIRTRVLLKWVILVEGLNTLERAVREATRDGAFADDERRVMLSSLDSAWHMLANDRPAFLPPKG